MRGKRPQRVIVQKMIRYCDEITRMLKRHHFDRDEFDNNTEFQFACGMCIIQIGELVAGLGEDFTRRYPDIPWRLIKGMRNIYAHDYDIVDNDMVWETITKEIPELKDGLQVILHAMSQDEEQAD